MSSQILIIADDLSGAADCTAGALRAGLSVHVSLDPAATTGSTADTQVWSIDTDTRRMSAPEATQVCEDILKRCRSHGQFVYKKIDSTLRGHVGAEIAAMLPMLGMAVVAPAFPDAGRLTRHGCQHLDGIALEETEIWHREGLVHKADIPHMLTEAGIRCALVRLETVRAGIGSLLQQLEYHASCGVQAVVCDAETNADLMHIARASLQISQPVFWVGSAGLASQLPAAAGILGRNAPPVPRVRGPILVVVGSGSSTSQIQARTLARTRPLTRISVADDMLHTGPSHPDWHVQQQKIRDAFAMNRDVILILTDTGSAIPYSGHELSLALAELVASFAGQFGGMISTGGETTRCILSALKATGLHVLREIEHGIPLSLIEGATALPLITKAGAFGSTQTLVHCYDTLRQTRH